MRMQRLMLTLAIAMAMPAHAAGTDVTEEMTAAMREARAELREARNELRALTRRIGELQRRTGELDGKTLSFTYLSDPKRAMVGVVLDQRDDGVFIAAVTPGGPAEKAGIRAGDKLVSVGGKAIAQPADGKARTPGEALFADVETRVRQCCRDHGIKVHAYFQSPITGGNGNTEFFLWARHLAPTDKPIAKSTPKKAAT